MEQNFLAIDLGATSGRTILGTFTDEGLKMEDINRFPNHLIEVVGHYYWDIFQLYHNIIEGLKIAAQRNIPISSIGIDTWGVDFVCFGKDGNMMRQPYSYRDPYTVGAPERYFSNLSSKEVYGKTGIQVMNFNSLFQLDTMRHTNDSALESANKILFMPDALSYLLTGKMVTEYTIASTSQLINAKTRHFDLNILNSIGLAENNFGRFVFPGEKIGELSVEVQKMTGLGAIPVIAVAGHDTASAVAAVPTVSQNFAYLSSGTWSLMGIEADSPVITGETEKLNFTNEGGVEGTIRLLKNICGMWLLESCRAKWANATYDDLIAAAQQSETFRSLINPDDPCFANPVDMEQAICEYCKKTSQLVPETIGQIVRCIFESLALRYRQVLDNLKSLSTRPIEVLHVIGGGSRNDMLNQFTANAIGMPVIAGPSEATAMGNVMIQAIAAGKAADIAGGRRLIRSSVSLKNYQPQDTAIWNEAYTYFKNIIS
ncbi:MAG: rhamnulokinase [Bacteroidaceae bacterium]|nr:rhamnulokinase [Bacteroidaceae bacterium]